MYCGKLLFIEKNKRCSWHHHKIKDETFYLQSGLISLYYGYDDDIGQAAAKDRHQHHSENENWEGLHDLQKAHEYLSKNRGASLAPGLVECHKNAQGGAQYHRYQCRDDADHYISTRRR